MCKSHFWNIDFKLLIIITDAFLVFKFTFLMLLRCVEVKEWS